MRHFSLFDDMDDGFKKKADDDYGFNRKNMYYTIDAGPDGIGGFLDLITWVNRNEDILRRMPATKDSIPSPEEIDNLAEYINDLWSANDTVLRINGEQLSALRMLSKMFTAFEENPNQEEFEDEYRDLVFDDIQLARESLKDAIPNYSSMEGLEDIPTMEENPEDLKKGETPAESAGIEQCPSCGEMSVSPLSGECSNCDWPNEISEENLNRQICPNCYQPDTFSTADEFGNVRCDNCGEPEPEDAAWKTTIPENSAPVPPATNAGKAFAAGNCPKCGSPTAPDELDPSQLKCSQCDWQGGQLPQLGENAQEVQSLENAFNAPSVEHPLGPHTGAEESGQELYTSGGFVKNGDKWLIDVSPSAGQREPKPGDLATIQQKSKAFNRPVPVTLNKPSACYCVDCGESLNFEDAGVHDCSGDGHINIEYVGPWTFKNGHHPA